MRKQRTSPLKKVFKTIAWLFLLFVLYVVVTLIHGTLTDFKPQEKMLLKAENVSTLNIIDRDSLSLLNWNVGYGGLGEESNFFYDDNHFYISGGKMVRPPQSLTEKNMKGVAEIIEKYPSDFYLFQEVDYYSRRSYFKNQFKTYSDQLKSYTAVFAINFKSPRVPIPMLEIWNLIGKVNSGLATYSRWQTKGEITRWQYPGELPWPDRLFNLDRCMAEHRFALSDSVAQGKELVIINSHNSAYDKGGILKKKEMDYMRSKLVEEYKKGNYVIVGADWNQCPPNFDYEKFMKDTDQNYAQLNIPADFMPEGWKWVYDANVPTNRKLTNTFQAATTFRTLIDFYLVSPNVEVLEVKGIDLGFKYSDHQPIALKVRLKK